VVVCQVAQAVFQVLAVQLVARAATMAQLLRRSTKRVTTSTLLTIATYFIPDMHGIGVLWVGDLT